MNRFIHNKERIYLALLLIFSIPFYLVFLLSGVGLLVIFFLIALPLCAHFISMGYIRSNGVKLTPQQFPDIFQEVLDLSTKMEVKSVPDVYIIQSDGLLNAFATRFFGKNMIVLYSEMTDVYKHNGQEELRFILAHELAHLKRNHILKNLLILPGNWVPFLGQAYSRACEYTCDAMAAHYNGNLQAAKETLTLLAIGRGFYKDVNIHDYLLQSSRERNVFVWLSEKLSTHPTLPKRIHHLDNQFGSVSPEINFKTTTLFKFGIVGMCLAFLLVSAGAIFGLVKFIETVEASEEFSIENEGTTSLMTAASEGDIARVEELIESREDINATDENGNTAIVYATGYFIEEEFSETQAEIVQTLLDNGASLNSHSEEDIPILFMIYQNELEMVQTLIEYGANIQVEDSYGDIPLIAAVYANNAEIVQILLQAGADPKQTNQYGETALDIAEAEKAEEIISLLE
ncbi:M48 family metallopeptidase [Metabacillus arenae]|uniref:M48 family metalloprotease n=1 Tax=Metabacillus arenae TaxID=2771434 RepID=A0A926NIY4_9BACI|nr:ankyrin repeat domain-containing protein [Metabacillus arenae]MBD1378972.1 M48 family metalloprotease [Metabacillus arenae]